MQQDKYNQLMISWFNLLKEDVTETWHITMTKHDVDHNTFCFQTTSSMENNGSFLSITTSFLIQSSEFMLTILGSLQEVVVYLLLIVMKVWFVR